MEMAEIIVEHVWISGRFWRCTLRLVVLFKRRVPHLISRFKVAGVDAHYMCPNNQEENTPGSIYVFLDGEPVIFYKGTAGEEL